MFLPILLYGVAVNELCLTCCSVFAEARVVVQGQGPGPRYGHVMDLVAQRYLVTVSGNDGES